MNSLATTPLYQIRKHLRRSGGKLVHRLQFIRITPRAWECRKRPRPMSDLAWELGEPAPAMGTAKPSRSRYSPHVGAKQLIKQALMMERYSRQRGEAEAANEFMNYAARKTDERNAMMGMTAVEKEMHI
jgi:hypothetical protein